MKRRDPLIQTLLSFFIPFYIIYWFYVTAKEVRESKNVVMPGVWLLCAPLLTILASIIIFVIAAIGLAGTEDGLRTFVIGIIALTIIPLALFAVFVLPLIYYYRFGGGIESVVGQEASRTLLFILFFFIPAAGVFVTQEKLNKLELITTPPDPTRI